MYLISIKNLKVYINIYLFIEKKLLDPVIDPREPWNKMISRIIEFE